MSTPCAWIVLNATGMPVPVVTANDMNLFVKMPGRAGLLILPRAAHGRLWTDLPESTRR